MAAHNTSVMFGFVLAFVGHFISRSTHFTKSPLFLNCKGASIGCVGDVLGALVGAALPLVGAPVGVEVITHLWPLWRAVHPATHLYEDLHAHAHLLASFVTHMPPGPESHPWLPSLHG